MPSPRLPTEVKGKAKKLTTKKRKFADADIERAAELQPPQSVQREEELEVLFALHTSFHQVKGPPSSRLSVVMVV